MEGIRRFWDEQARLHKADPRATTPDYWLRELEINSVSDILQTCPGGLDVLDIGCGNGYSTLRIRTTHPTNRYVGGDYSEAMIAVARDQARGQDGVTFEVADVLSLERFAGHFDVVISDRCLINLSSPELQREAVRQIWACLRPNGQYLAIENFVEAQENLNQQRRRSGLPPIPIRWHNLFLNEAEFISHCSTLFRVREVTPISSTYYLITRVVYSKLCQLEGREPDYEHPIYKIATELPPMGDFGPVKLVHMVKR